MQPTIIVQFAKCNTCRTETLDNTLDTKFRVYNNGDGNMIQCTTCGSVKGIEAAVAPVIHTIAQSEPRRYNVKQESAA